MSRVADPRPTHEHPLLGAPRRDAISALLLAMMTAAVFILVADGATRGHIDRADDLQFPGSGVHHASGSASDRPLPRSATPMVALRGVRNIDRARRSVDR